MFEQFHFEELEPDDSYYIPDVGFFTDDGYMVSDEEYFGLKDGDKMENKIVVSSSFTMAAYLVANPNVVVSEFNNGKLSYFKYDINTGKFYCCCPSNKVRNKWYEARGLKQHFDRGMHDMFSPKRDTLKQNIDDEGDLPY